MFSIKYKTRDDYREEEKEFNTKEEAETYWKDMWWDMVEWAIMQGEEGEIIKER
jgi:hypothetical protein